jgi:hypothetical protein
VSGPWDNEPDEWEGVIDGFECCARRNATFETWGGYVAVPETHPAHDLDLLQELRCHGGVTHCGPLYSSLDQMKSSLAPCTWVGFDCGHAGDFMPGLYKLQHSFMLAGIHDKHVYRGLDFVKAELTDMVQQLRKLERG